MKRLMLILTTVCGLLISLPSAKAFWFCDMDQRVYHYDADDGFAGEVFDCLFFSIRVGNIGDYSKSIGLIFYHPLNDHAAQFLTFESSYLWGNSLNGYWKGQGSVFYAAVNNNKFYTTYMYQWADDSPQRSLLNAMEDAPPPESSGGMMDVSALKLSAAAGAPLLYMHNPWGDTYAIYGGSEMYLYSWPILIQYFPMVVYHASCESLGFMFYQPYYNAIKIVDFGVKNKIYPHTIEGHWRGFGQPLVYATVKGAQGYVTLETGTARNNVNFTPAPAASPWTVEPRDVAAVPFAER